MCKGWGVPASVGGTAGDKVGLLMAVPCDIQGPRLTDVPH